MSRAQVVRPAGAGHETLYVLLVAALILMLAASVVSLRGERQDEVAIAAHQLDARRDLNAAEQGIHTDLWVAADEIRALHEETGSAPETQALADEGLPPFVADASSQSRGGHQWSRLENSTYLGRSQDAQVAGSFLMILAPSADTPPDIWLRRDSTAVAPDALDRDTLIAAGWQQVVTHFDAGVTRQHRH
ncbi:MULTISPECIES: DUF6162 family protein [unclassified Pseudomonas]|uniref:DUF6162 family protein n=1 Tax=unclassified Pseudomonas TaxID=196821 RepID=UPI002448AE45|nr:MULTISPECIES: DUF6162 family protein [unclassified Pseudomonas]MDH0303604.1 DUF6162 family protein [Pseudomonas sp. GD04091]MDH1987053.1 DUF6162 family protein [Pseudomonas sp. GD03689]